MKTQDTSRSRHIGAPAIGSRVDAQMHATICWLILTRKVLSDALQALVDCPDYRHIQTHQMDQARQALQKAQGI